jgi:propionyl-CoA synthetase
MGRTDDIINVAGHRLSTGGIEEVLASHPAVAECAVIGMKDAVKGEAPCGFVVLKSGVVRPPAEIEEELVALVRDKVGPVAAFKLAVTVARLPKTRSGKILRGTMKKIADGDAWAMPATIDDPAILDEIGAALQGRGVGRDQADVSLASRFDSTPISCVAAPSATGLPATKKYN